MSTYTFNHNNHPSNNSPQGDGFHHILLMLYIVLNGIATGRTIKSAYQMFDTGCDRQEMISLLLYLLLFIYTAQRIHQIIQDKKNNKNNQR
ncbi:MAG: hypothetical protein IJX89_01085 [Alphaproteobacteria bacterium]|nr:hypothetical protein [Alphaproteobacteria bacterium]